MSRTWKPGRRRGRSSEACRVLKGLRFERECARLPVTLRREAETVQPLEAARARSHTLRSAHFGPGAHARPVLRYGERGTGAG